MQKILVIDSRLAFIGGLDLCFGYVMCSCRHWVIFLTHDYVADMIHIHMILLIISLETSVIQKYFLVKTIPILE